MGNNPRRQGRQKRVRANQIIRPLSFCCAVEEGIIFTVGQIVPVNYAGSCIPCQVTNVTGAVVTFEEVRGE